MALDIIVARIGETEREKTSLDSGFWFVTEQLNSRLEHILTGQEVVNYSTVKVAYSV